MTDTLIAQTVALRVHTIHRYIRQLRTDFCKLENTDVTETVFAVSAKKENVDSLEVSLDYMNYKVKQICDRSLLAMDPY